MGRRCRLRLWLDGWLTLKLAMSLGETTVARVGRREDTEKDVAVSAPTSVADRRPANSQEPMDSIVGQRLITAASIATGSSEGTSHLSSSIDMYGV
jgi:hypothetical protein